MDSMEMNFNFKVEGLLEMAATLEQLPQAARKPILIRALKAAGAPMAERMALDAPLDPAADHQHLADSMTVSATNRVNGETLDDTAAAVAVGPSKDAFWGLFQEYGTVRHGAQPFARPGFDGGYEEALTIFRGEMWLEIVANLPTSSSMAPRLRMAE